MIRHKTAVLLVLSNNNVVQRLSEYANNNWYMVDRMFEFDRGDDLDACITYCVETHIDAMLVESLTTLGDSIGEVLQAIRDCDEKHINIYSLREDISIRNRLTDERTSLIKVLVTCKQLMPDVARPRGRQLGYRKSAEVKREEYSDALRHIEEGRLSDRAIARLCGCGASTVRRLRDDFTE